MQNREEKLSDAANLIENNLVLLGATAIEDKLQHGVGFVLNFQFHFTLRVLTLNRLEGC